MIIFNKAICPNCGAALKINKNDGIATCDSCNTDFILELTDPHHKVKVLDNPPKFDTINSVNKPIVRLSSTTIKPLYLLFIISLILILAGGIMIGVCYDGYELKLEDNTVLCSNIYKCIEKSNNITYLYKLDINSIVAYDQYNIYFYLNGKTYTLSSNRVYIKGSYAYLNEMPLYVETNLSYEYISLELANSSIIISGIVMLIIGCLLGCFLVFIYKH